MDVSCCVNYISIIQPIYMGLVLRKPSETTEESRDNTGEWARELFTKSRLAGSS